MPWKNDFNPVGLILGIVIKTLYLPIIFALITSVIAFFLAMLLLQLVLLPAIVGLILINPFLSP
jgi:hypothetical protein